MKASALSSFLCLLLVITGSIKGFSQNSYVRQFSFAGSNTPTTDMFLWGVENDGFGGLSLLASVFNVLPGTPTGSFQIIGINQNGSIGNSFGVGSSTLKWSNPWDYKRRGNYHAGIFRGVGISNSREALFVLNFETGNFWARQTASNTFIGGSVCFASSDRIISSHYYHDGSLGAHPPERLGLSAFRLDNGIQLWSRFYRRSDGLGTYHRAYQTREFPSSDFSAMGLNYLLKISPDGDLLGNTGVSSDSFLFRSISIDANGNVYLAGRRLQAANPTGTANRYWEGFVAKLDSDYGLLWSKRLTAEAFEAADIGIQASPDGHVVFTYVTWGDLPVISGKISPDGDLLWYRGYEFYRPQISIGTDSSIYFATFRKYFPDGSWQDGASLLAKTDPNGDIDGCPQFAACLSLVDMPLPLETWEWTQEVAPELPEIDVEVVPVNFATTPYCGTPTPPSAGFSLPDTACQFSCLSPDSLQNRLAHYRQWRLTGPGVDTLFADSTFSWCYNVPGRYTVEQEIWLLGCSEFYSRSIEILPDDLLPPLGEDRSLCDTPYELKPVSNRLLRSFLWSDGSTGSSLNVSDSGTYSLLASDGYCSVSDTVALRFVRKELTAPPLDLGSDTTLCPVLLPYILRPQSPYSEVFFIDNSTTSAQEFALSQAGNYTISTWIEDCLFSASLQLEVEPCPVPIYLPNSFSPNDDGINDRIVPQGEDYRGIRLEVYDRWGGLRHQSTGAPFDWDGKSDGKPLGTGVYVVVFYYQNLRSLQEEHIAQDVLLIR